MMREEFAARKDKKAPVYTVASAEGAVNPKVLPRRLLADEEKQLYFKVGSREFRESFEQRQARWFSADCHRSQYGYPFRVGIELALENRHRAVTLVSLACSGAEVSAGLFLELPSREGAPATVRAQFDQLSELICQGGAAALTRTGQYTIPTYKSGSTSIEMTSLTQRWCPPERRKRTPDVVLLSIGGNDVGFGGLVAYSITESASDLAPIAGLVGSEIRFTPQVSRGPISACSTSG